MIVLPVIPWIGSCACEGPKPESTWIDFSQAGNALDQPGRILMEASFTVHQVLNRIVRPIADERLWIDGQPRLSLGAKNIAGVQIGSQEHIAWSGLSQLFHHAQTFTHQARIPPEVPFRDGLLAP